MNEFISSPTFICAECGRETVRNSNRQKYCSDCSKYLARAELWRSTMREQITLSTESEIESTLEPTTEESAEAITRRERTVITGGVAQATTSSLEVLAVSVVAQPSFWLFIIGTIITTIMTPRILKHFVRAAIRWSTKCGRTLRKV